MRPAIAAAELIERWFPPREVAVQIIPDYEPSNLGIFDIHVNGVLVHSRQCPVRICGQPGHMFVHNDGGRQMAIWHAIEAVRLSEKRVCPESRKEYTCAEYEDAFSKEYSNETLKTYWVESMLPSPDVSPKHRTVTVVIRHSSEINAQVSKEMIQSWFQNDQLVIDTFCDDSDDWNFEITVNGVLIHSRSQIRQKILHEETWDQQGLVWRAIKSVLR